MPDLPALWRYQVVAVLRRSRWMVRLDPRNRNVVSRAVGRLRAGEAEAVALGIDSLLKESSARRLRDDVDRESAWSGKYRHDIVGHHASGERIRQPAQLHTTRSPPSRSPRRTAIARLRPSR